MSEIILSCSGIHKSYAKSFLTAAMLQERLIKWRLHRKKVQIDALRDVSLAVKKGEWVGIYGPNGSGKSTLLKILAGVLRQDSGTVSRHGTLSTFLELGVGFHPERKAEENIYLHGLLQGFSPKEIKKMQHDIITFAGIESHLDLPIKCYSTGLKLRLAFAAAAQVERDIYLFDEVLAVGDAAFQAQCIAYLEQMKRDGKTVLIVNHGLESLEYFCDRIVMMDHGSILSSTQTYSSAVT